MHVHDTVGLTLDEAVNRLGMLPLCFGAAWKIVDLLLEHALEADGITPKRGVRWTIVEKTEHARAMRGRANPLSGDREIWERILGVYATLEETRNSLVHRTAVFDAASGSITGVDRAGLSLRTLSKGEQEHFSEPQRLPPGG